MGILLGPTLVTRRKNIFLYTIYLFVCSFVLRFYFQKSVDDNLSVRPILSSFFFLFLSFSDIAFSTPVAMTKAVQDFEIDGLLIDNYALTRFSQFLEKGQGLRVERTIEHPITYGLVLPSGTPQTTQCVRRYMRNYNHEIFDHIAKYLIPIKVRNEVK